MAFTDWVGMQDQALSAKKRAIAQNQYSRDQLAMQYGLDANGAVDPNNQLGSIYQGNAATAGNYQAALAQSVARGFSGKGGLGSRGTSQTRQAGLLNQAQQIQQATSQRGYLGIQDQLADTDYQNTTQSIGRGQADETAQRLAANPVQAPVAAPTGPVAVANTDPRFAAITPAQVKKNPTIYRTLRNSF